MQVSTHKDHNWWEKTFSHEQEHSSFWKFKNEEHKFLSSKWPTFKQPPASLQTALAQLTASPWWWLTDDDSTSSGRRRRRKNAFVRCRLLREERHTYHLWLAQAFQQLARGHPQPRLPRHLVREHERSPEAKTAELEPVSVWTDTIWSQWWPSRTSKVVKNLQGPSDGNLKWLWQRLERLNSKPIKVQMRLTMKKIDWIG